MEFHEKLKYYRTLTGKTQQDVADYLGIDKSTYAHYESGRRRPNPQNSIRLAKLLQIPIFPQYRKVVYPDGLLDRLEDCMNKIGSPTSDFQENKRRINEIAKILDEVLDVRNEAMYIDDLLVNELNLDFLSIPFTILNVDLDYRGEQLIKRAMKCKEDIFKNYYTMQNKGG